MRCTDFLNLYSDFRDDAIEDAHTKRALAYHLAGCSHCAEYHRSLTKGTELLRSEEVEPSERFRVRLRCQLALRAHRTPQPAFPWPARVAASLLVAAVVFEGVIQTAHQIERPLTHTRSSPAVLAEAVDPLVGVSMVNVTAAETPAHDSMDLYFTTFATYPTSENTVGTAAFLRP